MGRFFDRVSYGAGIAASLVLLAIILLTLVEVVSRYVLRNPLILSDELGGYAMVAATFLGMAYCAQQRSHIRITFIMERIDPEWAGWVRIGTLALGLAFVAMAAWVSWKFLGDSWTRNMRSNSMLMTPLKWPQLAIPVGFTLFALVLAGQFVHAIRNLAAGRHVDEFATEEF